MTPKFLLALASLSMVPSASAATCPDVLNHRFRTVMGKEVNLCDYADRAVLVVNTASRCGYTPQFSKLQALYDQYKDQGLVVIGFPSNDFRQELASNKEVGEFCQVNYGVTFPMFAKVDVIGDDAHPLFTWLKSEKKGLLGGTIKWNFTKFLVGRDGQVSGRYAPTTEPKDIADDIRAALAARAA